MVNVAVCVLHARRVIFLQYETAAMKRHSTVNSSHKFKKIVK